jgi:hypothetical protein
MKYLPTKEMTGVDLFYMHNYVQPFVQIVICYIESLDDNYSLSTDRYRMFLMESHPK